MALNQSALLELTRCVRTADGGELMRRMLGLDAASRWSTPRPPRVDRRRPHERTAARMTHRNGARAKTVSDDRRRPDVKIPKLRAGSFFPSLLEPAAPGRRRVARGGHAGLRRTACPPARSMTWSPRWVARPGSASARSAGSAPARRARSRAYAAGRWTERRFPYVFLDATYCKARVDGRVVSQAVVIATGVSADGRGRCSAPRSATARPRTFWTEFLRGLRDRGLDGVQLVISDAHRGLVNAIDQVIAGATWQRSSVNITGCGTR